MDDFVIADLEVMLAKHLSTPDRLKEALTLDTWEGHGTYAHIEFTLHDDVNIVMKSWNGDKTQSFKLMLKHKTLTTPIEVTLPFDQELHNLLTSSPTVENVQRWILTPGNSLDQALQKMAENRRAVRVLRKAHASFSDLKASFCDLAA
jgi:hypothetical protein